MPDSKSLIVRAAYIQRPTRPCVCKVSSVPSDDTQPHLVLSISQGELNKIAKRRTENIRPATGASFTKQGNIENDPAKTEITKS